MRYHLQWPGGNDRGNALPFADDGTDSQVLCRLADTAVDRRADHTALDLVLEPLHRRRGGSGFPFKPQLRAAKALDPHAAIALSRAQIAIDANAGGFGCVRGSAQPRDLGARPHILYVRDDTFRVQPRDAFGLFVGKLERGMRLSYERLLLVAGDARGFTLIGQRTLLRIDFGSDGRDFRAERIQASACFLQREPFRVGLELEQNVSSAHGGADRKVNANGTASHARVHRVSGGGRFDSR